MIVMKFGGTSIADAAAVERVSEIIRDRLVFQPVVINSAMGKTTRNLLDIAHLSKSGQASEAQKKLEEIITYHLTLGKAVIAEYESSPTRDILNGYFDELHKLLNGMAVLQDLTPRSLDRFLSYGERISTAIMTQALRERGLPAILLDARQFVITDDRFGHARPLETLCVEKIRHHVLPVLEAEEVPVIQGYIGATQEGVVTTLGFEGSDFSASLIGAAIGASDIQIWKDVTGIMTADPAIVPQAKTIKQLTFDEAAELTFFGAKVLHPDAIEPARKRGIPVHVCNSKNAQAACTRVDESAGHTTTPVQSITYKKPVSLLRIVSNRSLPSHEFLKTVFDKFDRERLAPHAVSITETSIRMAIVDGKALDHVCEDLEQIASVERIEQMGMVTLVGENLKKGKDLFRSILSELGNVSAEMLVDRASPINMTLVIPEDAVEKVVQQYHAYFFGNA